MSTPLAVGVTSSEPEFALSDVLGRLDASGERLRYTLYEAQSIRQLVRALRRSRPDVVLVVGPTATRVIAAWIAGTRVAWMPDRSGARLTPLLARIPHAVLDREDADVAASLARAAARPGAGLEPERPVTVVTTVLDEGPAAERLLEALVPQLGPDDELIVVDGGSTDDTVERLRRAGDARVRVLELPGAGISAGRNAAIAAARHDVICCTDAGCDPRPGWLASFKAAYSEHDPPTLVAGVYDVTARTPLERALAASGYPRIEEARRPGPLVRLYGALFGRTFDATLPTGRSLAFRRDAWAAAGGFTEGLDTGEDVTLGRAVAAAGGSCVLTVDAAVEWEQRPSLAETARMYFGYGVGSVASGDRLLLARDLARAAAIVATPLIVASGNAAALRLVLGASGAYLSLPAVRALREPRPLRVLALTPVAVAVKDVSKAAGCIVGLARALAPAGDEEA